MVKRHSESGLGRRLGMATVLLLVVPAGLAQAEGFRRGEADLDGLYAPGHFAYGSSITYIDPKRGFSAVEGETGDFDDFSRAYSMPSFAASFGGEAFACAATYTEPFAADADYSGAPGGALPRQVAIDASGEPVAANSRARRDFDNAVATARTRALAFSTDEFGLTCRASYQTESGRFSLLGGILTENLTFDAAADVAFAGAPASGATVDASGDFKPGYRLGAAYEYPDLALRAQFLYRSEIEHDDLTGGGSLMDGLVPLRSHVNAFTSPRSLGVNLQSGVSQNTLVTASFRWTDWSTLGDVLVSIENESQGLRASVFEPFDWDDGYTATLGIGHAFTDTIAAGLEFGFDSGVSTGAETTYTDFYRVGGGFAFSGDDFGEITLGGVIGYLTGGEQRVEDGAYFDAEVDGDMVYGLEAGLSFAF